MSLDVESLKAAREKQKTQLRELEVDQRRLEAEIKSLRQREIRTKREIEALTTLIELHEAPAEAVDAAPAER